MTEFYWLSSFFLGAVFIVSGLAKLFYIKRFRDAVSSLELFPRYLNGVAAAVLPPIEIALGTSVLLDWKSSLTGPLLLMLLLVFLGLLIVYRIRGGVELSCGCFADFEQNTSTLNLILRNILLLIIGIPVLFKTDAFLQHSWKEWALGTTVVLGVMLSWSLLNRLATTVKLLLRDKISTNNT